jgi:transposase
MDDARHDSNPVSPKDDPLQRIAALERRVAVRARTNDWRLS